MGYIKEMKESIEKIEQFDKDIVVKVEDLKASVKEVNFKGMIVDGDNKQVTAHKNKVLRVVNRVIDKFEREVEQFIVPLLTQIENEEIKENEEVNN